MEVVRFDLNHMPEKNPGLSLALGNFDGVHVGHQALFVETALHAKGDSGVLLFSKPFGEGPFLSSIEDKIRFALSSRLDIVYVLENDDSLFFLSPEEFIDTVLKPLGCSRVVMGEDFRFGAKASGNPETLKAHFDVEVVPLLCLEGTKVSSSTIKDRLLAGYVEGAREMLGKSYEIVGKVRQGFGNGRKIGFPTANLELSFDYLLPKPGVYCGVGYVNGIAHRAMVNVGTNPTVGALSHPIVEAHFLDFDEDCYGKTCYVSFLAYLREEKKFSSLEELRSQLLIDLETVKEILA